MPARPRLIVLLSILSLPCLTTGQDSEQARFSGKWQAKIKDSVICTIQLRVAQSVSGSIADCHIHTDSEGNLEEAEPTTSPSEPSPISNARLSGQVLAFDCKEEGEDEPLKFEMRLLTDGTAEVTITNAPVKIKPVHFVRHSPE